MKESDNSLNSSQEIVLTQADWTVASRLAWLETARHDQTPPVDIEWLVWLIRSGRGWGKTRVGAEYIVYEAIKTPKTRWAVVAATSADVRDTCFEGESGIIEVLKRYRMYDEDRYNRTFSSYRLPNGSRIKGFSAEKPDRLRGPQHHGAWCDELAAWTKSEAYDQLKFGLRLGKSPKVVITTTPRPIAIIKKLVKEPTTYVTTGSIYDNIANLPPDTVAELEAKYGGTRLGRQELYGEILEDVEGALWKMSMIEPHRLTVDQVPPTIRTVVAVDPAMTNNENSDHTGIITVSLSSIGHFYVLADNSIKASPDAWARVAVDEYRARKADRVVYEDNAGGDMTPILMRAVDPNVPVKNVHASQGKQARAEPISALYEQGRVHHVGTFHELEQEMTEWVPNSGMGSPDRLDALVWAIAELMEKSQGMIALAAMSRMCPSCGFPNKKVAIICARCQFDLGEVA